MAERGERRLQGHGQHAGRPPVQGGRSAGTHVELGGVGSAQDTAHTLVRAIEREMARSRVFEKSRRSGFLTGTGGLPRVSAAQPPS